jgi:hypothetical protein
MWNISWAATLKEAAKPSVGLASKRTSIPPFHRPGTPNPSLRVKFTLDTSRRAPPPPSLSKIGWNRAASFVRRYCSPKKKAWIAPFDRSKTWNSFVPTVRISTGAALRFPPWSRWSVHRGSAVHEGTFPMRSAGLQRLGPGESGGGAGGVDAVAVAGGRGPEASAAPVQGAVPVGVPFLSCSGVGGGQHCRPSLPGDGRLRLREGGQAPPRRGTRSRPGGGI